MTGRDALRWRNHADIPFRAGHKFRFALPQPYQLVHLLSLSRPGFFGSRGAEFRPWRPVAFELWRLVGVYAGRVLKGAKPMELPVEQVWCRPRKHPCRDPGLRPSCVPQRRSSNANSLQSQNSAGFRQICAIFQRDNLRRHFRVRILHAQPGGVLSVGYVRFEKIRATRVQR